MKKLLPLFAVILCFAACQRGGQDSRYTSAAVEAYAGGVFFVEITANLAAGFSWNITNAQNLKYVKLTSSENITEPAGGNKAGAPSVQRFEFAVLPDAAGKTEVLQFAYFRPWETGVPPAEQKTYTVSIK